MCLILCVSVGTYGKARCPFSQVITNIMVQCKDMWRNAWDKRITVSMQLLYCAAHVATMYRQNSYTFYKSEITTNDKSVV